MFLDYVGLLNKKMVSICLTSHDRQVLLLGLVSLLRHTMGTDAFSTVNHNEIFRYCFYLLEYHILQQSTSGEWSLK